MKQLQAELADANPVLLRLQNEETKLLQDIATEQGRWAEINQRLEDLDRRVNATIGLTERSLSFYHPAAESGAAAESRRSP